MTVPITLHFHPFASYCQKVLIALYETATPFNSVFVDLGDPISANAFRALWPAGKMPVLRDEARDRAIPESSIIIEYLQTHYPGSARLIPADPDLALDARLWDRFFDLHVQDPMQRIVADRLRPEGKEDPTGVAAAKSQLLLAYGMIDARMNERPWATGETFTMADCAAAPALYYAAKVQPIGAYPHAARYLERLLARASFARVLEEARPFLPLFPKERS